MSGYILGQFLKNKEEHQWLKELQGPHAVHAADVLDKVPNPATVPINLRLILVLSSCALQNTAKIPFASCGHSASRGDNYLPLICSEERLKPTNIRLLLLRVASKYSKV